ncbi:MAG: hypothetical protein Tsb0021_01900 [Chlamydiales bacterium]
METAKLSYHEWALGVTYVSLLFVIGWISYSQAFKGPPITAIPKIHVAVQGEVQYPGNYELPLHSSIDDLLHLAKPRRNADLTAFHLSDPLKDGQLLQVSPKMIRIFVKGAVNEEQELLVPKGTSLKDVHDFVLFNSEADVPKMNKKRKLRDQEIVIVPLKQKKKSRDT